LAGTTSSAAAARQQLDWATSKTIGGVTEIAVLAPIRKGCIPGERRTYEERLVAAIDNLAGRHQQRLPTELGRIPAIHFGRMIIIRPEQYLVHSNVQGLTYFPDHDEAAQVQAAAGEGQVPAPIDDYVESGSDPKKQPELRSFLLTLVEFDGDLKVYMRDIAKFLASDFDVIFQNCEAYPTTHSFERFWLWVRRYQINTNLLYAPYSNLTAVRIKQLEDFKRRFDAFVARVWSPQGPRVGAIEELFDEFLRHSQQYASNFPTPGGTYETGNSQVGG
jgi:hypothetical protein